MYIHIYNILLYIFILIHTCAYIHIYIYLCVKILVYHHIHICTYIHLYIYIFHAPTTHPGTIESELAGRAAEDLARKKQQRSDIDDAYAKNLEKQKSQPAAYGGSVHISIHMYLYLYGVATVRRIDKIIGLFCKILSLL